MRRRSLTLCSIILFLTLLFIKIPDASPKGQYVEPLLFGMKASLPYDIANLFNVFPIQGGLALLLGIGLAGILFFGVITAPFGYMFGVPSEKYVMGDFAVKHPEVKEAEKRILHMKQPPPIAQPRSFLLDYVRSERALSSPRTIFSDRRSQQEDEEPCCQTFLYYFDAITGYLDYWEPGFLQKWKPFLAILRRRLGGKVGKEIVNTMESTLSQEYTPEFRKSMFYLIPEKEGIRNGACEKRMVCHAHGALQYVPVSLLKIYHQFSKKMTNVPLEYAQAIRTGIQDEALCAQVYSECEENAFSLTLKSYMSLLPDKEQIGRMPRRKQKMYMNSKK